MCVCVCACVCAHILVLLWSSLSRAGGIDDGPRACFFRTWDLGVTTARVQPCRHDVFRQAVPKVDVTKRAMLDSKVLNECS